ncbi:MAG: Uma2 family endonuclease [Acidobacteria bacterium]|jgi:Uma2 family endonuclease|nr:Uma2 family endonuclease [Acidobacteriota bacterium]
MSALPKPIYNADEYLALEESAEYRSQFYNGEIFAMAGTSRKHNVIAMNVASSLHFQLRNRPCEIYQNDMRVKVGENFYTYPDIVVVCGEPQIERKHGENLLNPIVLIEVLSPSTERFDRGEKARLYRLMPSLKEYILISQDKPYIEHFVRQENGGWLLTESAEITEVLQIPTISCELNLSDIYARIDFSEETFESK